MTKRGQTLLIDNEAMRQRLLSHIAALNLDKPWDVTIKRHVKRRSLNQNNLYHDWVGLIAVEAGYSHEAMHSWLKAQFLKPEITTIDGQSHMRWSTKELTTKEMKDYMDLVYAFATSFFGLLLPLPEEMGMR